MANVAQERSRSVWSDAVPAIRARKLDRDAECEVVVVGSGIAGLSCAYELERLGKSVVVIDRGPIGGGMTARTTGHLVTTLDDYYHELIHIHGEHSTHLCYESQVTAINRIEAVCMQEGIGAEFVRVDGYLFAAEPGHQADLEREYDVCRTIGADVHWADRAPIPGIHSGRCLCFPNQARMHPMKYLGGLAARTAARGTLFYADTACVGHDTDGEMIVIHTEAGPAIRAGAAVFATNSPVNDRVTLHTKQAPFRTYALAGRVPRGSVPDVLAWDTLEAYHYVRLQPLDEASDLLIVGGEDHRSGEAADMAERLAAIEAWARVRYPTLGAITHRWSGQVMEPIDFMPFSGRNPGDDNIYVHTGDSGQGLTNGVAGSLTIVPLILGGHDARYAEIFDPDRKPVRGQAISEFVRGVTGAAANLAEHLRPSEVNSVDNIRPGHGAILREGSMAKHAVYRGEDGSLVRRSANCTHAGCIVHWNPFERCWDCPCHGSQFAPDGSVLNGPALQPLSAVETRDEKMTNREAATESPSR